MASQKVARARKPSSHWNTGRRKGKKGHDDDENIPPLGTRPKPRPTYKKAAEPTNTTREDEAATALVLMGNPSSAPDTNEHDHVIEIADVVEPTAEDPRDNLNTYDQAYDPSEEDDEDNSSSSDSEGDEDLDEAVAQVIPKLPIPARAKVNIPFEVPYKNGTRDLTGITSRTSFDDFLVAKHQARPQKPAPKLLESDDSWDVLITDVQQYIKSCQGKNRGKGEVKPFSILPVDMDQVEDAKGKAKRGKKGSKSKKDDLDDQHAATPALKEHELYKKIEKEHYCQECKSACVILDNGDHHVLTHPELATWAMLRNRAVMRLL
ncbi:hypothetical protein DFH07DRAFT_970487 [Mycena maculata]|uniref:Uncharacterized protein n=1 Tax=Mycena maculata TaxID=230809 RepID=A0AAD7HSM1_9AGAR|nr:hypothetical protein DFH07DRAFT_970487 [Mycena maculata]